MNESLKDKYISKTTCRLLRYKLDEDLSNNSELSELFDNITFTTDIREKIYCLINNISIPKHCENNACNNKVRFCSYSVGYSRFCSIKCSKNPEELKKINHFGGVHKIRQSYDVKTAKQVYQSECRRLTEQNKKLNMHIINPHNYPIRRNGVNGAYQVDHIISVIYGYENNIAPDVIANINNLQTIPWRVNAVKNKFTLNTDIDEKDTVNSYTSKVFENVELDVFIEKYCLSSNGKINTKLSKMWFINRNVEYQYHKILELTSYLDENEKIPYRVLLIRYFAHKRNIELPALNRYRHIRELTAPTMDYVDLDDDDYKNYLNNFMWFDKKHKKYRKKSNSYSTKHTANIRGVLWLYYKYECN